MTASKRSNQDLKIKKLAHCNTCKADVLTEEEFCPLCGDGLVKAASFSAADAAVDGTSEGTTGGIQDDNKAQRLAIYYPDLSELQGKYNLAKRIGLFLTFLVIGMAVILNFTVLKGTYVSVLVAVVCAYLWFVIISLLRRGVNQAKRVTFHVIMASLFAVAVDVLTNYEGWSVSYVVPAFLLMGIIAILVMNIFMRSRWQDYVFYQFLIGVLGFIPLVLYLLNLAKSLTMVLIVSGFALVSVLFTLTFADRSLKEDFVRRFNL